jgi:hypothetical protein
MERIPEPELMEDEAQARAYAEANFQSLTAILLNCSRPLFLPLAGLG